MKRWSTDIRNYDDLIQLNRYYYIDVKTSALKLADPTAIINYKLHVKNSYPVYKLVVIGDKSITLECLL